MRHSIPEHQNLKGDKGASSTLDKFIPFPETERGEEREGKMSQCLTSTECCLRPCLHKIFFNPFIFKLAFTRIEWNPENTALCVNERSKRIFKKYPFIKTNLDTCKQGLSKQDILGQTQWD